MASKYPLEKLTEVGAFFIVPADHPGAQRMPSNRNPRVMGAARFYERKKGIKIQFKRLKNDDVLVERIR